jgi:8-oxo-dGTP pyrophosphatase MutT (NUDIX family)
VVAEQRASAPVSVRAAGGVVWRPDGDGGVEVLLVHRPQYDDWSFPKGKRDPGETDEDCAAREVEEETGLKARLGKELPRSVYEDKHGREKVVRYWEMTVKKGSFEPNDEVDEVCWLGVDDARRRLSYPRDEDVLDAFAARVPGRLPAR